MEFKHEGQDAWARCSMERGLWHWRKDSIFQDKDPHVENESVNDMDSGFSSLNIVHGGLNERNIIWIG